MDSRAAIVITLVFTVISPRALGLEIWRPYPESVDAGSELVLFCSGQETEELGWLHNGMHLEDEPGREIVTEADDNGGVLSSLTISEATVDDSGNYKCSDAGDYFNSDEVSVTVTGPEADFRPLTLESNDVSIEAGASFTLTCEGSADAAVTWLHDGMAIDSEAEGAPIINDNIDEDTNTVVSLLTVEEAVVEDGGQYTCSDANDYFNRDSANVAITEAAEVSVDIVDPEEGSVVVAEGDSTTLRCLAQGTNLAMAPLVWAYPEGIENVVISDAAFEDSVESLLTIEGATPENAGEYVCADPSESVTASVTVTVE